MTTRTTHDAYYVTARDGGAGKTAWLCGPFETRRAAEAMVRPVSYAARKRLHDPRFQFAGYGVTRLTQPAEKPFKPGTLDLAASVDDVWINLVVDQRNFHR